MFRKKLRSGLSCWYAEALCQGLAIGFSEVLIVIWYSRQMSNAVHLGVMLTLPAAVGAITQAFATRRTKKAIHPHKLACYSIAAQIAGLCIMASALSLTDYFGALLFAGQCLYWMGGMTALSPTQDILARSVPVFQHNRLFSRRAMLITAVTLICNFVSAWTLDRGLTADMMVKFIIIAALARLLSLSMIARQGADITIHSDSAIKIVDPSPEALVSILKLSLCMFIFRCAVNISSPFYSAFMLKDLNMSLSLYSTLTAVPLITKAICLHNWARLLDDNRKFEGLVLATIAIGVIPILWSVNTSTPMLGFLQALSGASWSGFDLISVLLIQHMYPRSITHKLGLFLALGSLGSVVGGLIGGLLLNAVGSYQWLFASSGVLRLVSGFFLLWYLRRNHLFRFHHLNLKHGLATLVTVRPSLEAAAKLIPLPHRKNSSRDKAA